MEGKFSAIIKQAGRDCSISFDGNRLPNSRGFKIEADVNSLSTLTVEMLIVKPFEVNGEGQIVIDSVVVNEGIARQVYESLKRIFDKED